MSNTLDTLDLADLDQLQNHRFIPAPWDADQLLFPANLYLSAGYTWALSETYGSSEERLCVKYSTRELLDVKMPTDPLPTPQEFGIIQQKQLNDLTGGMASATAEAIDRLATRIEKIAAKDWILRRIRRQ